MTSATGRRLLTAAGVLITLVLLVSYGNLRHNGLVSYDDLKYLTENEQIRQGLTSGSIRWAFTSIHDSNWIPLTWLSYMLDVTLFGINPAGHHLVNLLLHIANSLLVMTLFHHLSGRVWCSAAVAMLFAVHPLHVESVAWAAERKDVLSTLFFLLTLHVYRNYTAGPSLPRRFTVLFLFLCGLLAKPMLVSLPLVLVLIDFWQERSSRVVRPPATALRPLSGKIPLFLLSLLFCGITFYTQRSGRSVNSANDLPLLENSLHALYNYAAYLYKTFWPVDLCAIYPYRADLPAGQLLPALLILLSVTVAAIILRHRLPYLFFGWFWYLATLAPVAGFIRVGAHSIADRYTYIPLIGIFAAVVWGTADLLGRRRNAGIAAAVTMVAVTVTLGALTWKQVGYWKDSVTLFTRALMVTDRNWVAHANLGAEFIELRQPKLALYHLTQAAAINPLSSDTLFNLGLAYDLAGDQPAALATFKRIIAMEPDYRKAYFAAGKTAFKLGQREEANSLLHTLQRLDPALAAGLAAYFRQHSPTAPAQ